MDTLKRHRGKDPQRIMVQHFNMVNGGNAAITIGNPEPGSPNLTEGLKAA
jgi:hypothetical protein